MIARRLSGLWILVSTVVRRAFHGLIKTAAQVLLMELTILSSTPRFDRKYSSMGREREYAGASRCSEHMDCVIGKSHVQIYLYQKDPRCYGHREAVSILTGMMLQS